MASGWERAFDVAPPVAGPIGVLPDIEGPGFQVRKACKSFRGAFFCGMEWDEWNLVRALVRPHNVVLELGGRFGTTSCVLSEATGNAGSVVAVEPDPKAHRQLLHNRERHNCSFHVFRGTVGSVPIALSPRFAHYATQTQLARPGQNAVPNVDVAALEAKIGKRFDTLLIDCEGCIESFFGDGGGGGGSSRGGSISSSNRRLLSQLSLILLEEDAPAQVDYRRWHARLRRHGFERIWRTRDTFDPKAAWSRNVSHSAWRRGGLSAAPGSKLPTCLEHAKAARLSKRWLDCLDPSGEEPMVPGCHSDPCPPRV